MSQQAVSTPSLIGTILEACKQVWDGRSERDIALHALTELGELAQEVQIATGLAPGKVAGADGIEGEALDLILCVVDLMHHHDNRTCDRTFTEAINPAAAETGASFTGAVLSGWRASQPIYKSDMNRHVLSIGGDLGLLCDLGEPRFKMEGLDPVYPAARIIRECIYLIRAEIPGTTELSLIGMARRKLDKWIARSGPRTMPPAPAEPDPVARLREIASGDSTRDIPADRLWELHDIASAFERERQGR